MENVREPLGSPRLQADPFRVPAQAMALAPLVRVLMPTIGATYVPNCFLPCTRTPAAFDGMAPPPPTALM
jgi:hypothetical protein